MNWMHQVCIFQDIEDFFAITRKLILIHLPLWHFAKTLAVSIYQSFKIKWYLFVSLRLVLWRIIRQNTNIYISTCIELNGDYPDILNLCLNGFSCLIAPKCFLPIVARRLIWALIIRALHLFFSFWNFFATKCWCVQMDVETFHIRFKEMFFPYQTFIVVAN